MKVKSLKAERIKAETENGVEEKAELRTDNAKAHRNLHKLVKKHTAESLPRKERSKVLPRVHTAISNAKASLLATYRGVSYPYLQNYLSEFSYKLNRRYFKFRLFDRLMVAATYHWDQ